MKELNSTSSEIQVSVVIVARNAELTICECIRSIDEQRGIDRANFEIILVDDGSTDKTTDLARVTCPTIRIISNAARSISANRNIGWRAATGDYVAFIDSDCSPCNDWLSRLLSIFVDGQNSALVAAVGGPNIPPPGRSRFYDCLKVALDTYVGSGGSTQGRVFTKEKNVSHLPGLNIMLRRDVLIETGGYDEAFALVGEDADLSKRLIDQGYILRYTPVALVYHHQRDNLKDWASNMVAYGQGRRYLLRRHPGLTSWPYWATCLSLPLFPFYSLTIVLCSVFLALKHRCLNNVLMIAAIFHCTHLPFSWGMIKGGFLQGDTAIAKIRWKRKKLYLMALKNAGNKGDEAIVVSAINRLKHEQSEAVDILLFGFGPSGADIRVLPESDSQQIRLINSVLSANDHSRITGLKAVLSFFQLRFLCRPRSSLVVCGGQWFHDLSLANHIFVTGLFGLVRLFGGSTGLLGVGIGPLKRSFSRRIMKVAFSDRSYLMVRDEKSSELLSHCGYNNVLVGADLAFELPLVIENGVCFKERSRPRLGICPCAWGSFENLYQRDSECVSSALSELTAAANDATRRGFEVVFLPSMNPEDYYFSNRIISGLEEHEYCEVLDTRAMTPIDFQREVGRLDCLLSMRLHPLIFAFNANTPFVAFNYAEKVVQFATQVNQQQYLVDMQKPGWGARAMDSVVAVNGRESSSDTDLKEKIRLLLDDSYRQFGRWLAA